MPKKFLRTLTLYLLISLTMGIFCPTIQAEPGVSARAAVLMEAESRRILMDVNAHACLPMASTTKIMTALVALEHCTDLTTPFPIPAEAVGVEGSSVYLETGEQLSMEQLLHALLLESANDAATAIAIHVAGDVPTFADMMNETALRLGLTNTNFTNPHGLYSEDHYTTAADLALLAAAALENETFSRIVATYKTTIPQHGEEGVRLLINHNRLLKQYPGAIGVKTGYTKRCGRCLVSAAEREGVRLIAVTLDAPDDWQDHTAMLDYGFTLCERVMAAEAGIYTGEFPVLGGIEETVRVSNRDSFSLTLPRDHGEITLTAEANRYLCAPIAIGEPVGELIIRLDGEIIGRLTLTAESASEAIEQSHSAKDRLKEWLHMD